MQAAFRRALPWLIPILLLNTLFLQQSHVLANSVIQYGLDQFVIRGLGVGYIDQHVSDSRLGNVIGIDGTALVCILVLVFLGHKRWKSLGRMTEILRTLRLLSVVGLPLGLETLIGGRFINWTVGTFQQFLPHPLSDFTNLDFLFATTTLLVLTTAIVPFLISEKELFLRALNETLIEA